ncbi:MULTISPECIES: helix-turn-helix domain-containing protein [unclassified Rhodococcus (in: high G+C Gram-positive bacteria)]|uniref:helix-turn-helix domain-containing protein n=1 Tax=unclassified Rhodococcus (in: high G+C Gram-positive bacteria) TaxID=192944 RepID=UPI0012E3451C|nr:MULTISPECIES: helix-turn-helix domain-containing protein [unclassified Rhodococcus (in: high G+C Gram-positive bacteria)]
MMVIGSIVRSFSGVDVSDIAVGLGYADQAHLIRDFRGVAGVTPGQYVRENSTSERGG